MTDVVEGFSDEALIRAVADHRRFNAAEWEDLPGVKVVDSPEMVLYITGLPTAWANGVEAARLRPDVAESRIHEAIEAFRAAEVSATWSVDALSRPKDLGQRLLAQGFRLDHEIPWMAADLAQRRRIGRPSGLVIQRVRTLALHDAWLEVMVRGFGPDPGSRVTLDSLGRDYANRRQGPWVRFVGFHQGRPVASSGLIVGAGVAGIYNVATLNRARRRGFGTALTLAAMRHSRGLGYRIGVLGASELGRGIYERLGFREVCVSREYVWEPRRRKE